MRGRAAWRGRGSFGCCRRRRRGLWAGGGWRVGGGTTSVWGCLGGIKAG